MRQATSDRWVRFAVVSALTMMFNCQAHSQELTIGRGVVRQPTKSQTNWESSLASTQGVPLGRFQGWKCGIAGGGSGGGTPSPQTVTISVSALGDYRFFDQSNNKTVGPIVITLH
jgi:hypothetical protein